MYKYYKELEDKKNFKISLVDPYFEWPDKITLEHVTIPVSILEKSKSIFKDLPIIDLLLEDTKNRKNLDDEPLFWMAQSEIIEHQEELGNILEYYNSHLISNALDLKEFFDEYLFYVERLIVIYSDKKIFLESLKKRLKEIKKDLENIISIEIVKLHEAFEYTCEDSWYITPTGYLYNSGGKDAHKEGNLVNAYRNVVMNLSNAKAEFRVLDKNNKSGKILVSFSIPDDKSEEEIRQILDNGYVEYNDFIKYTNLMSYRFPELIGIEEKLGKEHSYQKNIITLIIGYIAAEGAFYNAFRRVSKSGNKEEIINKIRKLTAGDLDDILVRFCKFSKISRVADKTITSASLNAIELFSEYLKEGWTLEILPPINYDSFQDRVDEVQLDSLFVSKHLDKEISAYKDKGKILIRK